MREFMGELIPSHWEIYKLHLEDPSTIPNIGIVGNAVLEGTPNAVIVAYLGQPLLMTLDWYEKRYMVKDEGSGT